MKLDKDVYTLVYKKFIDRFTPYPSLTISVSVLLYIFTLQPINSTSENDIYTYPITLEHKNKDNIITEYLYFTW